MFLKIPQISQENTLCHLFYITSLGDCFCENIKALLLVHVSRVYAKVTMTWNWDNRSISLISDAVVKLVWNNDLSEKCDNNWNNFMDFKNIIVFVDGHLYTQPATCMFKVSGRNTRTECEICSLSTIKTPERRQVYRSGVFIVNFEHILHLVLVFLLLTLNR